MSSTSKKSVFLACTVLTLATLSAPTAEAAGPAAQARSKVCTQVDATGIGQDMGGGSTVGTIYVGDEAVATSAASFVINGMHGPVARFTGPIKFTSDVGTLTAEVRGKFNTSNGRFRSVSTSVSGTDLLAGVFGKLRLAGLESLTDGSFTETIRGHLCVRL